VGQPARPRHLEPVGPAPVAPVGDAPAAPDGTDRFLGVVRRPQAPAIRGPAAGVPDLAELVPLTALFERDGSPVEPGAPLPSDAVRFQHTSERRFARLLDFYGLPWEYEPHEFPIDWDGAGTPVASFRPDFYLPTYDLHIEITTSAQRLVTKKNRKLRLLREHHPDVRCKLFYQRDYLELVRKYRLDDDLDDVESE